MESEAEAQKDGGGGVSEPWNQEQVPILTGEDYS